MTSKLASPREGDKQLLQSTVGINSSFVKLFVYFMYTCYNIYRRRINIILQCTSRTVGFIFELYNVLNVVQNWMLIRKAGRSNSNSIEWANVLAVNITETTDS